MAPQGLESKLIARGTLMTLICCLPGRAKKRTKIRQYFLIFKQVRGGAIPCGGIREHVKKCILSGRVRPPFAVWGLGDFMQVFFTCINYICF